MNQPQKSLEIVAKLAILSQNRFLRGRLLHLVKRVETKTEKVLGERI